MSLALPARSIVSAAPAYSVAAAAPAYSVAAAAPAYSVAAAAPAYSIAAAPAPVAVAAAPAPVAVAAAPFAGNPWADYSPQPVVLGLPALPAPDYRCYQPPQVPPGQNRLLRVDEPGAVRNLEQNFNDVRTAVRENNTHVQRNKVLVTNINRNHNHLLRIVTNENNFEHNLTNQIVRVADTHRQRIENVPGQQRNFRDFKATQRVENLGCRRADFAVAAAPAPVAVAAAPAPVAVTAAAPALSVAAAPAVSVAAAAGPAWGQAIAPGTWVGSPAQWI